MSAQAWPQWSARGEDLGRGQHHAGRSAPTTLLRKGEEIRFLEQEVLTQLWKDWPWWGPPRLEGPSQLVWVNHPRKTQRGEGPGRLRPRLPGFCGLCTKDFDVAETPLNLHKVPKICMVVLLWFACHTVFSH